MNVSRRNRLSPVLVWGTALLVLGGLMSFGMAGPLAPEQDGAHEAFPDSWFYLDRKTGKRYTKPLLIEGKKMPTLKVKDWVGEPTDLAKLEGKVVVIDFWGTWCRPCVAALPKNAELYDRYKKEDVLFIGVHDSRRGADRMEKVAAAAGVTYPICVDDGGVSAKAWQVAFWPTYAVIDHKGIVRGSGLKPTHVEQAIQTLIGERAADKGS